MSMVWEDFTRKDVGDGETRAYRIIYTQDFAYKKGSKNVGTSHLKCQLEHHKGPSKISVQVAGPIKDTPRRCKKYTPQRGSRTASVPVAFDSESERSTIENLIARMPSRICLTLDVWNSNNTTGYVFITGQFIDSDWNIHKRLPSVVIELYPESIFTFSQACCKETLQVCQEMVKKVTDYVKYVKASKALEEYFPDLKQLQVLNTRNLSLDDQTKLNTTYEMLLAASELKKEFSRLDTLYPDYFKSPSGEDWNLVDNLCTYLKLIFDTATVVMDPQFKMQLVDFSFAKIFGDEAASYINIVDEGIHQLFLDYVAEIASQQSKSELDQYLDESLLPRSHEFDVIRWWKLNEPKYPTVSKMARDILTLHVSTVNPESIFDTGVKEMDRYRCTLKPETVEALYYAKDWLRTESIESMDSLVKMEFQI
nr:zinc finger BED domain-containing protein DAYSLEEPER-like [Tanacetum cinerariifolium]